MTEFAKVKDHKDLVRDMYSKAILVTDQKALLEHRKNKQVMRSIIHNNEKIDRLECEMGEIKNLLIQLLNKEQKQ